MKDTLLKYIFLLLYLIFSSIAVMASDLDEAPVLEGVMTSRKNYELMPEKLRVLIQTGFSIVPEAKSLLKDALQLNGKIYLDFSNNTPTEASWISSSKTILIDPLSFKEPYKFAEKLIWEPCNAANPYFSLSPTCIIYQASINEDVYALLMENAEYLSALRCMQTIEAILNFAKQEEGKSISSQMQVHRGKNINPFENFEYQKDSYLNFGLYWRDVNTKWPGQAMHAHLYREYYRSVTRGISQKTLIICKEIEPLINSAFSQRSFLAQRVDSNYLVSSSKFESAATNMLTVYVGSSLALEDKK